MVEKRSLEYAKLFIQYYCKGTNIKKEVFYYESRDGFEVVDTRSGSICMDCFDYEVSALSYDESKQGLEHIIQELQEICNNR